LATIGRTQNPPRFTPRGGSTPPPGTNKNKGLTHCLSVDDRLGFYPFVPRCVPRVSQNSIRAGPVYRRSITADISGRTPRASLETKKGRILIFPQEHPATHHRKGNNTSRQAARSQSALTIFSRVDHFSKYLARILTTQTTNKAIASDFTYVACQQFPVAAMSSSNSALITASTRSRSSLGALRCSSCRISMSFRVSTVTV